jgi:hypothetical protein
MNLYDLYGSIWDIISDRVTRVKSRGLSEQTQNMIGGTAGVFLLKRAASEFNTWL